LGEKHAIFQAAPTHVLNGEDGVRIELVTKLVREVLVEEDLHVS
jgi:hypothetical protein